MCTSLLVTKFRLLICKTSVIYDILKSPLFLQRLNPPSLFQKDFPVGPNLYLEYHFNLQVTSISPNTFCTNFLPPFGQTDPNSVSHPLFSLYFNLSVQTG